MPNTLRYKVNEGTLVCNMCGLVDKSNIIDQTKEQRSFAAENSNSQQLGRVGDYVRMDQLNTITTELRGTTKSFGRNNNNQMSMRTSGEPHIIALKKKKDWYRDYFNQMKRCFRLK